VVAVKILYEGMDKSAEKEDQAVQTPLRRTRREVGL
jgi:hypothetical protein